MKSLWQTNVFYAEENIKVFIFNSHWACSFCADPNLDICDFDDNCRLDTETLL